MIYIYILIAIVIIAALYFIFRKKEESAGGNEGTGEMKMEEECEKCKEGSSPHPHTEESAGGESSMEEKHEEHN